MTKPEIMCYRCQKGVVPFMVPVVVPIQKLFLRWPDDRKSPRWTIEIKGYCPKCHRFIRKVGLGADNIATLNQQMRMREQEFLGLEYMLPEE